MNSITVILLHFFLSDAFAEKPTFYSEEYSKSILSELIQPECEYSKGDESSIFTLHVSEASLTNDFMIMKGIDLETCKAHQRKINLMKRKSHKLTIKARQGIFYKEAQTIVWTWINIKSNTQCDSHILNDCDNVE